MRDDRSRFSTEFRLQELEQAVISLYQQVQQMQVMIQDLSSDAQAGAPDDSAE